MQNEIHNFTELKILIPSIVSCDYLKWLKDKDVTKFSDNQYKKFSKKGQLEYIKSFLNCDDHYLYGIFFKSRHVGNVVLGPIDFNHKNANISYMIGDKSLWGIGLGTIVISKIIRIAKIEFQLKKLYASCAQENIGSQNVLLKNNFKIEGRKKLHLFYNSKWMDCLDFGLLL